MRMFLGKQTPAYYKQTGWLQSVAAGLLQLSVLKSRNLSAWRGERQQNNSTSKVAIKTPSTWGWDGGETCFLRRRDWLGFLRMALSASWEQATRISSTQFPKQSIKPDCPGRRTGVRLWGSGDVVVPLFVSTLIDPIPPKHTHALSCLWHNCRSVRSVSLHSRGTEACWRNQSCGYWLYEQSSFALDTALLLLRINTDWRDLRSFWDSAGNLESQLESWKRILVQTKCWNRAEFSEKKYRFLKLYC